MLCLYWTNLKATNIYVKFIQWDKLWYDFPILTVNHYRKKNVPFKKVGLPESLIVSVDDCKVWFTINNYIISSLLDASRRGWAEHAARHK